MFGFLNFFTRAGRQNIVRPFLKQMFTPDEIARMAAQGVSELLERGAGALSEERVASISRGCELGGTALANMAKAVSPDGDGGTTVTESEREAIAADLNGAVKGLLTQEQLDAVVEIIVSKVP